jgi:hypothetical protein
LLKVNQVLLEIMNRKVQNFLKNKNIQMKNLLIQVNQIFLKIKGETEINKSTLIVNGFINQIVLRKLYRLHLFLCTFNLTTFTISQN